MKITEKLPCFWPTKGSYRAVFLICACLLTFGSYFCYELTAIMTIMMDDMDLDFEDYQLLYAVYSFPNAIMTVFGGYLLDRTFGLKAGAIFFAIVVFVGQSIFAFGATISNFEVMVFGRFIFALGAECVAVAQSSYVARVFTGKELSLAFGITLSVSRIGSAVNMLILPTVADKYGLAAALWVGAGVCLLSVLLTIAAALLYTWGENRYTDMKIAKEERQGVRWKDILEFPLVIWILFIIVVLFYCTVFPFISIATGLLQDKYGYSNTDAAFVVAIPYGLSAILSPLLGFSVDRIGYNPIFVFCSCCLEVLAIFLFLTTKILPVIPMVVLGVAYSLLASSLWPCVAKAVHVSRNGTAYGLAYAIQNCGLAITAISLGAVMDSASDGYNAALQLFIGLSIAGAVFALILIFADFRSGKLLSKRRKVGVDEDYETLDDEKIVLDDTSEDEVEIKKEE